MTAPTIRTARLGASLIARQKWRWALNVTIWVAIYVLPIIPGLITQAFFNRVSGADTGGLGVPVLVGLIAAYGFGRIAVMFWGMWVDIHFRFRVQTLLRRNLLARIYERPGAQALAETPGEAMTRFREDVEETDETVSWTVDLVGIVFFLPIALGIMASIDARVTAFVFVPMVLVIFLAARAKDRIRRYRETARAATGQVTGALSEMFGAVPAIKVAGAEEPMIAHFRRLNDARRHALVRDKTLTQILESLFWNSVSIGTGIILVAAAQSHDGRGVHRGRLRPVRLLPRLRQRVRVGGGHVHRPLPAGPGVAAAHDDPAGRRPAGAPGGGPRPAADRAPARAGGRCRRRGAAAGVAGGGPHLPLPGHRGGHRGRGPGAAAAGPSPWSPAGSARARPPCCAPSWACCPPMRARCAGTAGWWPTRRSSSCRPAPPTPRRCPACSR